MESAHQTISMASAMEIIMHDEAFANVVFECDNGQTVSACKQILGARSAYFKSLLYGNMMEQGKTHIKLHGVSDKVLRHVVEFLHTDGIRTIVNCVERAVSIPANVDQFIEKNVTEIAAELLQVLDLARQYFLPRLESLIEESLITICEKRRDLIHKVLQFALNIHSDTAAIKILESIKDTYLSDDCFIGFEERVLCFCVGSIMDAKNADQVLRSLARWGQWKLAKINDSEAASLGSVLENVLRSIKYELVSPEVMEKIVGDSVLPPALLSQIYLAQAKYLKEQLEIARNARLELKVGDVIMFRSNGIYSKGLVKKITNDRVKIVSLSNHEI
jgi:hypothetical protein